MDQQWGSSAPASKGLLAAGDPEPAIASNPGGCSPFVLIGDHAGRAIPRALGDLGLPPEAMERHIAWDIGVAGMGLHLSALLDAPFIHQAYSRLVIDCNRQEGALDRAPAVSDGQTIPGNLDLGDGLAARVSEIYAPYQAAIAKALESRAGQPTWLVSLHSFTPVMNGLARPWRVGVLHRGDSALSRAVLARLRDALGEAAGDNQPYAMDGVDNTVPLHADARGLDYLELEVRQDLIADEKGQVEMAEFLAPLLLAALQDIGASR